MLTESDGSRREDEAEGTARDMQWETTGELRVAGSKIGNSKGVSQKSKLKTKN